MFTVTLLEVDSDPETVYTGDEAETVAFIEELLHEDLRDIALEIRQADPPR